MAWTTPKTWNALEVLTAADLNTYVRDNLLAVARGTLDYGERTTDIGPDTFVSATDMDATLLRVDFTLTEQRRVKITGYVRGVNASVANARIVMQIREVTGGAVKQERTVAGHSTGGVGGPTAQIEWCPLLAAGTYAYKLSATAADAASFTFQAAATYPAFLIAEDIGAI